MRTSIPWPHIFAEGVAIVVSILLAFGIQAWWDGRQEREEERQLLETLVAELQRNKEIVAGRKQFQGGIYDAGLSMIRAAEAGPTAISADFLDRLLGNATWFGGAYSVLETGAARTAIEGGET